MNILLYAVTISLISLCHASVAQEDALQDMINTLSNLPSQWKENDTMNACSWEGITCIQGNITTLNLTNKNISGSLSDSIANVTSLKELIFSGNLLHGDIPKTLLKLQLRILELDNNNLSGDLPPLNTLETLQTLNVVGNANLTGCAILPLSIPSCKLSGTKIWCGPATTCPPPPASCTGCLIPPTAPFTTNPPTRPTTPPPTVVPSSAVETPTGGDGGIALYVTIGVIATLIVIAITGLLLMRYRPWQKRSDEQKHLRWDETKRAEPEYGGW